MTEWQEAIIDAATEAAISGLEEGVEWARNGQERVRIESRGGKVELTFFERSTDYNIVGEE
jgi:hypothetical protein